MHADFCHSGVLGVRFQQISGTITLASSGPRKKSKILSTPITFKLCTQKYKILTDPSDPLLTIAFYANVIMIPICVLDSAQFISSIMRNAPLHKFINHSCVSTNNLVFPKLDKVPTVLCTTIFNIYCINSAEATKNSVHLKIICLVRERNRREIQISETQPSARGMAEGRGPRDSTERAQ